MPRSGGWVRSVPWAVVSTALLTAAVVLAVATYRPVADTAADLGSRIRCPVCEGVPIADSPAPMAVDMMALLTERIDEGATRQEAIDAVLGAYPGSLLLDPTASGSTIVLWLVPAGAIAAGLALALTVRRSRKGLDQGAERVELEHRLTHIRNDLDDLAAQVATGDIDLAAAHHLRQAYSAELVEAKRALSSTAAAGGEPPPRSPRRVAIGATMVVVSLGVIVIVAGFFITDRPDAFSGVAEAKPTDAADYSNETLAAVIAANEDHPDIDGMRLALAERLFEEAEYQTAFPYYLAVAQSEDATSGQAATALTRLGWMAYDGNNEVDTALALLAQAQEIAPEDPFPLYLHGLVTWCGAGDPAAGAVAFRRVLEMTRLDEPTRAQVEGDLARAEAGEPCA